jgi:nucleolar complex protein 3
MVAKQNSKRPAPPSSVKSSFIACLSCSFSCQGPSKKRKLTTNKSQSSVKLKKGNPKKQAFSKDLIPIPSIDADEDEDIDLSEQDLEILGSASFLDTLDYKGIARYEGLPCSFSVLNSARTQEQEGDRTIASPQSANKSCFHP